MSMRKLFFLVATLPSAALAAPVDERIDAAPDGQVDVQNIAGDIVVTGWDENAVHVTGDISENAERLEVRRDGNRVIVEVIYPDGWERNNDLDTDLLVNVPRRSSLAVETVSADVSVSSVQGELELTSVSGDIDAQTFGAEVRIASVSGDVTVDGRDEPARTSASAVSGDIELDRVSGEIDVEAVSGDIDVTSGLIERAEISSVSGDVSLRGPLAANARIRANSTSGDVRFDLQGNADAQYELSSFSGDIHNCFGPAATSSRQGPPNTSLRFTEGSAGARVEVSTMSGDIGLCR